MTRKQRFRQALKIKLWLSLCFRHEDRRSTWSASQRPSTGCLTNLLECLWVSVLHVTISITMFVCVVEQSSFVGKVLAGFDVAPYFVPLRLLGPPPVPTSWGSACPSSSSWGTGSSTPWPETRSRRSACRGSSRLMARSARTSPTLLDLWVSLCAHVGKKGEFGIIWQQRHKILTSISLPVRLYNWDSVELDFMYV